MDSFIQDHPAADGAGKVTFLMALLLNIYNWISHVDINQIFVVITSILGSLYMFYKLRITILEWKEKKEKRDARK